MATVIRLARYGAKKRPYYHIVVTDSRNARNSGNVLEVVGKYDPMLAKDNDKRVVLKVEELKAWLKGFEAFGENDPFKDVDLDSLIPFEIEFNEDGSYTIG